MFNDSMEQYFLSNVLTYSTFLKKYKQIEGYLHSLTHNVIVGKIDDFAEVLQEIIDEMSEECQVSNGDKMVVKAATQQKLLCVMVQNGKMGSKGLDNVATISYHNVKKFFNVKNEKDYLDSKRILNNF